MNGKPDDVAGMEDHVMGDRAQRKRFLLGSTVLTVPGTLAVVGGFYYGDLPRMAGVESSVDILILAVQCLFVALLPYAAVCITILHKRLAEGAHNPLVAAASERLAIHCRVMQNTLEQLVWFGICTLALATVLKPSECHILPIAAGTFCFARFLYWWGYLRKGTLGRRYGVQTTFTLNIGLLVLTAGLLVARAWMGT